MKTVSTSMSLKRTEFKIGWTDTQSLNELGCPVCSDKAAKPKVLDVTSHLKPHSDLDLFKCLACASSFYYPIREAEYSNQSGSGFSARFAIELGAGIDSMIRTLNYLSVSEKTRSLLDIGCGVGFLANFAQKILKWNAIGLDPSPSAAEGQKLFGDFILTADTGDLGNLESKKFDIVYASEVVEHVENPLAFVNSLRERLSDDGVLILTTPDAESIDKSNPFISLLAALSPGFHVILFSEKSMEMLLRQAGFKHIKFIKEPRRLFAYASDTEISVDEERNSQAQYLDYLYSLAKNDKSKSLKLGALYRLFKEYVNCGDFEKSAKELHSCEEVLSQHFKADLNDIDSIIARAEMCKSLDEFGAVLPFCICGLLYYKGMHLIGLNKPEEALDVLRGSFKIASTMLELEPAFLEEPADLLWNAKFHEGFAYLLMGNKSQSRDCFNAVLDAENKALRPPDALQAKCLDQIGISYFQEGMHEKALLNFETVLSKFASTAEKAVLDESRTHADLSRTFIEKQNSEQATVVKNDAQANATVAVAESIGVASASAKIQFAIDLTWSDDHVIAVQGWMFSEDGELDNPTLTVDGHTAPIEFWHPRPDVAPFFPHLTVPENCGFWVYIPRKARHEITISTGQGNTVVEVITAFTARDRWLPDYCTKLEENSLDPLFAKFVDEVNSRNLSVLEIGSRIVSPGSISKREFFTNPDNYTGFDMHPDDNTDICGDAHKLSEILKERKFDAVFSLSVLEHLAMPWVVAREIALILNQSGITYHQTPFAWPEHDRPCDYWRFSDKGLMALFPKELGWEIIDSIEYSPVSIHPFHVSEHLIGTPTLPGFAASAILARKIHDTDATDFKWGTSAHSLFGESFKYPLHEH